jgi:hypothetical protein
MIKALLCINWTAVGSLASAIGVLITLVYTIVTYCLFKQNSTLIFDNNKLLLLNQEAFELNKKNSQIQIYLEFKKEFTSDFMTRFVSYLHLGMIEIVYDRSIKDVNGYEIHEDRIRVNKSKVVTTVLGNVEDLALLFEEDLLSLDFINSGYGDYILTIGNSAIIRELLKKIDAESPGSFGGFKGLYNRIYNLLPKDAKLNFKQIF